VLLRRLSRLVRSRERLHLLTLLTIVDMAAVNPTMLTPWKCRLLADLTGNVERVLDGLDLRLVTAAEQLESEPMEPDERRRTLRFLETMPPEYGREVGVETAAADRHLLDRYTAAAGQPGACVLDVLHTPAHSIVTVIARDQERLLSDLCGLLAAHDVTILQARIFTRLDGIILDRFTVADAGTGGRMTAAQEALVTEQLPGVLEASIDVGTLLEKHRVRWSLRDRRIMEHPVQVHLDPSASERYTVIELHAPDQTGLLHQVAAVMADFGVSIHQAFITTEVERAVDAFYVTDPLGAPLDAGTSRLVLDALRDTLQAEG
jgi:[protein-PII] uridylyltransferase